MIKDNQKMLNKLHILLDAIVIVLSFALAYWLRFETFLRDVPFFKGGGKYPLLVYARSLFILVPLYLIIYYFCKLYTPKRGKASWVESLNIVFANILGIPFFTFILYFQGESHFSRGFIILFFVTNLVLGSIARLILSSILRAIRRKGYNLKHIILVGYSRATEAYIDRILANPQWGYYIHGIIDDNMAQGTKYKKIPVIGNTEDLVGLLGKMTLDEIAITLSIKEYGKLEDIVSICEKSGVHTKFIPDYNNVIPTIPYTEDLDGLPVINIRNVPLSNTYNQVIKRIIDIIGALVGIVLASVPMLIVAVLIKITSPGPILFSQVRVGRHNKEFKMYKFRSMEVQSDKEEKKAWTTPKDPRVTGIGKFIRRTSIDELPQFFNVLIGDMSLVGPRPERPFFVEKFKEEIPRYMIKHQVAPGITGWAQINGYRGDTSIRKRIEHDLYYIENWTLALDIKILILTFFKGFINKNAY